MTDERIIDLFLSRDEDAIRQINAKYGRYCRSLMGRILPDGEDVSECINDLWLRVWESIPPRKPAYLNLYLAKIARNLAYNRLRDQRTEKRGAGEIPAILDELAECIPGGISPEEAYQTKELTASINAFVRSLPRWEGDVFLRRYFFAESPAEIANRYGMRENTVSVMLYRTRGKLRDHLEQEIYES